MRVSEIIRNILDLIDQADTEEVVNDIDPNPEGYEDNISNDFVRSLMLQTQTK